MFERFSRSWRLVKASAGVLQQDKELLVFPLISTIAMLAVMVSFAIPVIGLGVFEAARGGHDGISPAMAVVAFLFYASQYFVIFFFNAALIGAAMIRLDGGNPTVRDGLRIATSRIGTIAAYALIAATVGMILRALQERVGFIGKIIIALIGMGWTLATAMVVPVLVAENVGPIQAIKESAALLRKTWGENVIGNAGLGLAFGIIFLAVIGGSVVLVIAAAMSHSIALIVLALAIAVVAIGLTGLTQAALTGIYSAALYRYATKGEGTAGFDTQTLQLAFAPK